MTQFTAFVTAISAVLASTAQPVTTFAESRFYPPEGIEIVIADAPQTRYAHDGRWYVEALKGREYAIRIRNPFGVRVAVALSVDGLNTIDARHTSASDARKWVLGPYETITISGWQTNRTEARHFEFVSEEQSYGQALGQTNDLGVISAVFFRERVRPTTRYLERDTQSGRALPAPAASRPEGQSLQSEASDAKARENAQEGLAATGMGRRTEHEVTQVRLDLESSAALSVNVRYEFRPQLVTLGVLPAVRAIDPLRRRERASGFEPGFSPVPPRFR